MPAMMPPGGMPPGGMPPGAGGGMPPGGNPLAALLGGGAGGGGAIAQVLQRLMSNPAAIQGMMNFMQGKPPTAGMPVPPSQGGQIPPGMTPQNPVPVPPSPEDMPMRGPPDSTTQGPPPDKAAAMAQSQIDKAGNTWDGVDAPTKNDIQRLEADPTPAAIKSFDQQFGSGMAEKYLGESDAEEQGESKDQEDAEGDQGSRSTPEYDE